MTGLYLHIPFCRSKCAYCDFPSWAGREALASRVVDAMLAEAALWAQERGRLRFDTVFIGGGTPTAIDVGHLERLLGGLRSLFDIQAIEFTVEANPGTVDVAGLRRLRTLGADRLSFGVQAAQDALLRRIGRIHSWEDFLRGVEMARNAGFENLNADMMTGLPGQTEADARETARRLAALGLPHVSCYGLKLEEGTPLYRSVQEGSTTLPEDDAERDQFHAARAVLEEAGLRRYEISNFAKPSFECRHNLIYWHNGDYLGLGCGAASHFGSHRRENEGDLDAYIAACENGQWPPSQRHTIGADEAAFETAMLALRLREGLDLTAFTARHGVDLLLHKENAVRSLRMLGLIQVEGGRLRLTERGMDVQNAVLLELLE